MTLMRALRKRAGMSINELASRSYVAASYISQIERRACNDPTPQVLKALADGLGWQGDPYALLGRVGEDE